MIRDIRLIAAIGRSRQIGFKGELPWPAEMRDTRDFREKTRGGVVIVGGRTFAANPIAGFDRKVVKWVGHVPPADLLDNLREVERFEGNRHMPRTVWIAGGAYTYAAFASYCTHAELTLIDWDGEADCWLPPMPWEQVTP